MFFLVKRKTPAKIFGKATAASKFGNKLPFLKIFIHWKFQLTFGTERNLLVYIHRYPFK